MPTVNQQQAKEQILSKFPSLDPARVERAAEIAATLPIRPAKYGPNGENIKNLGERYYIVKGSKGWYLVDKAEKSCSCPDSMNGNICKHRIAVYYRYTLYPELQTQLAKGAKQ